MDMIDYQQMAARLSSPPETMILDSCMGMISGSGDIVYTVRKWLFARNPNIPLPTGRIIDLCGDILVCCARLLDSLGNNMHDAYSRSAHWYDACSSVNRSAPVEIVAFRLATICCNPMQYLYDSVPPVRVPEDVTPLNIGYAAANTVGIITHIRDLLEVHCGSSLEEAMEHSCAKMLAFYPAGSGRGGGHG